LTEVFPIVAKVGLTHSFNNIRYMPVKNSWDDITLKRKITDNKVIALIRK
jgi:hypothetical protein